MFTEKEWISSRSSNAGKSTFKSIGIAKTAFVTVITWSKQLCKKCNSRMPLVYFTLFIYNFFKYFQFLQLSLCFFFFLSFKEKSFCARRREECTIINVVRATKQLFIKFNSLGQIGNVWNLYLLILKVVTEL